MGFKIWLKSAAKKYLIMPVASRLRETVHEIDEAFIIIQLINRFSGWLVNDRKNQLKGVINGTDSHEKFC